MMKITTAKRTESLFKCYDKRIQGYSLLGQRRLVCTVAIFVPKSTRKRWRRAAQEERTLFSRVSSDTSIGGYRLTNANEYCV